MRENINAQGLATYDFYDIKQKQYNRITRAALRKFKLLPIGNPISDSTHIQQEFSFNQYKISIEWEFMIGYIIYSTTPESNDLAREVARFVHEKSGK